jgi:hypothetical protein
MGVIAEAQRTLSQHSAHAPRHLHGRRVCHPPPLSGTTRSGPHMREWSRTAATSVPSPWSRSDILDNWLLHKLGDEAARPGGVTRASFVAGTLCYLDVGLCRGNFLMYRASGGMLAWVSRRGFWAGLAVPTHKVIE